MGDSRTAINDQDDEAVIDPIDGLLHGPELAPWSMTEVVHAPHPRSRRGHTDGWIWATDTFSVCGVRDGRPDDAERDPWADNVLRFLTADLTAPLWAAEPRDLGILGGFGRLRDWGCWDLRRVSAATDWVAGVDGRRLVVAVDPGPALRIVAPSGRVAVVMGLSDAAAGWFPTIDLPVTDAVAEAIANGSRERHADLSENGRSDHA